MSGNSSIRGYLLQTIITLLDAFEKDNWVKLTLEPNILSDKVDIVWYLPNQQIRVTQVKSSQNQINLRLVKKWAEELQYSIQASDYELILIGPCSQNVIARKSFGQVLIPTPHTLNIESLIEQAAHKLDYFLEKNELSKLTAKNREIIIQAFVTKLETFSTKSLPITKDQFGSILVSWIVSISENTTYQTDSLTNKGIKYKDWVDILAILGAQIKGDKNLIDIIKMGQSNTTCNEYYKRW